MTRPPARAVAWAAVGLIGLALCAAVAVLEGRPGTTPEPPAAAAAPMPIDAQAVARGAYLARAGNCAACHSRRGGAPYAGGKGLATPFGTVYAGNLTPDPDTGLGRWSVDDFRRALHEGRSRDGRLLAPAFPYPEYTRLHTADVDALFAYLRSLAPVHQPNRPHELRFPYGTQSALALWRLMYFTPGRLAVQPERSDTWNRGAYLVRGLGHCEACHAPRNRAGATVRGDELGGGLIPMQRWYAPSLAAPSEGGVQDWPIDDIVRLLRDGRSARGVALGPMAEVVMSGTQHLSAADLRAMAEYLHTLPRQVLTEAPQAVELPPGTLEAGARLYGQHCAECHGERGEGRGPYGALAGLRTVTQREPANLVKLIVHGGFGPSTPGHPRPHGMPPFGHVLDDAEIAALASFVRQAWGNAAPGVRPLDVLRLR